MRDPSNETTTVSAAKQSPSDQGKGTMVCGMNRQPFCHSSDYSIRPTQPHRRQCHQSHQPYPASGHRQLPVPPHASRISSTHPARTVSRTPTMMAVHMHMQPQGCHAKPHTHPQAPPLLRACSAAAATRRSRRAATACLPPPIAALVDHQKAGKCLFVCRPAILSIPQHCINKSLAASQPPASNQPIPCHIKSAHQSVSQPAAGTHPIKQTWKCATAI